ncbi:unnamed protein product [Periconia digitata]|uniref:Uncharacterized protein n=1 Tax=Periconia digitata TaxID=1303443 RepID=A0A9W4U7Y8_9PLEO|nr:unnamed protein product [Periconia digitata]
MASGKHLLVQTHETTRWHQSFFLGTIEGLGRVNRLSMIKISYQSPRCTVPSLLTQPTHQLRLTYDIAAIQPKHNLSYCSPSTSSTKIIYVQAHPMYLSGFDRMAYFATICHMTPRSAPWPQDRFFGRGDMILGHTPGSKSWSFERTFRSACLCYVSRMLLAA